MSINGGNGGILIISSSPNGDTIENILRIIFDNQSAMEHSLPHVDRVTFLETEGLTKMKLRGEMYSLSAGYEKIFARLGLEYVEFRRRRIVKYAEEIPAIIMAAIREVGREQIILDLTSGKKDITGSLYTAATICNISNMIYVDVLRHPDTSTFYVLADEITIQNKYTLSKFHSLDALERLAAQNCMEFVIYKKSVEQINDRYRNQSLDIYCSHLINAVDNYFNGNAHALSQSIRNIGVINEQLIGVVSRALVNKYQNLNVSFAQNSVFGPISAYSDEYHKLSGKKNRTPAEEVKLTELSKVFSFVPTLFYLLKSIQLYRNLVSHEIHPVINREDAKLMIDMMLKMLNGLCDSDLASELFDNE